MPKPVAGLIALALGSFVLGCGPGGIASDGSEFGSGGSGTADDEIGTVTSMSDPDPSADTSFEDSSDDSDPETETETETETGANDWTDPETETETETGEEPEPVAGDCTRVWLHVDPTQSHGHLGATPIGPGPAGGFVSVTPILASDDGVNVDARIRSWLPSGELLWERQVSWADHRDDPLALLTDELDDVYLAGRINANTFEDAMIAKLDGTNGELVWTFLRGEPGGYSTIAYNGAAIVAAGRIGESDERLEVLALEPDTGELLWGSSDTIVTDARGLVVADGKVEVLIDRADKVEILRYEPPASTASSLAIVATGPVVAQDLELLDENRLMVLYTLGSNSFVAIVERETGELLETVQIDEFVNVSSVGASELVVLPGNAGFGIAGSLSVGLSEEQDFVLRLDAELNTVCSAVLSKADVGVGWPPELRGLVVGDNGALYSGSYVVTSRRSVFARWD